MPDLIAAPPHPIQWVTASPLWDAAVSDPARMQRPAILRFASDTFMEDLAARLADAQPGLAGLEARPVSFRAPAVGPRPKPGTAPTVPLKLYQAVHGHFNLVTAALVCRQPGLPDHAARPQDGDQIGFVMRRVFPGGAEWAWTVDPGESDARRAGRWTPVDDHDRLAAREELLPLFPLNFREDDRPRRLYAGLIPISTSQAFVPTVKAGAATPSALLAAPKSATLDADGKDVRINEVEARVFTGLDQLARALKPLTAPPNLPPAEAAQQLLAAKNAQQAGEVEVSRFLLLDLADVLSSHIPDLWAALQSGTVPAAGPRRDLYQAFDAWLVDSATAITWRQALVTSWAEAARINGDELDAAGEPLPPSQSYNLRNSAKGGAKLPALLAELRTSLPAALPATPPPKPAPEPPLPEVVAENDDDPPLLPKLDQRPEAQYLLRCVFVRACVPPHDPIVSRASTPFALAPFFDPDAPTRPIRITLPTDTSLAGLRKFRKNVAFLISDKLRGQMSRSVDLQKAMDGQVGSGLEFKLGEICSFSLPIITLVAFIVLMIFIMLLNFVFWWLMLLRICIPIPLISKKP